MDSNKDESTKFSFLFNYNDGEVGDIAKVKVQGSYVCKDKNMDTDDTREKVINEVKASIMQYIMLNDVKKINRLVSMVNLFCLEKIFNKHLTHKKINIKWEWKANLYFGFSVKKFGDVLHEK